MMHSYQSFAVIGGDLRQAHVANQLAAQGKTVYALLLETNEALHRTLICEKTPGEILPLCDAVVFPLPLTADDEFVSAPFSARRVRVADCLSVLRPGAAVFAGKISPEMHALAEQFDAEMIDYLEREELAVKNAVITAEGAVAIAMEELPIALFGSRCLIVGHGRIARALIRILRGLGASVTVAARSYGSLAEIEAEGCRAVRTDALKTSVKAADVVINTVPARMLTEPVLSALKHDALVIDLASRPGGVDLAAAGRLGVKTIWALSLPGKTAPITAGEIILHTIENCLSELEEAV